MESHKIHVPNHQPVMIVMGFSMANGIDIWKKTCSKAPTRSSSHHLSHDPVMWGHPGVARYPPRGAAEHDPPRLAAVLSLRCRP